MSLAKRLTTDGIAVPRLNAVAVGCRSRTSDTQPGNCSEALNVLHPWDHFVIRGLMLDLRRNAENAMSLAKRLTHG